ncbi:LuxR C-terminal-related transcriptional regulator [Lentzea sp. JNUCC 0626]|uniref:helix-turn-helix transcriptional regulator n=1 Tax=Lentzea sp. JNUCC 0626 TaxID=3367513 RepID=UPI003749056E
MTDLVGREVECESLVRLAVVGRHEGVRLAFVRGSRGAGKSTLLAAVRDELAAHDVTVWWGAPDVEVGDYAALSELHRIAVELMAQRPLVVLLDDVDAVTSRWVGFLVRRAAELPLVVVLAGAADPVRAELAELGPVTVVDLAPLAGADVLEVVERAFDSPVAPAFALACERASGGNPLLLRRLLDALAERQVRPDARGVEVAGEIGRRMATGCLPHLLEEPHVPEVARAIAVLGTADARTVGRLLRLPEPFVAGAVDSLRRRDVLAGSAFRHEDVSGAVLSAVPTAALAELRRRAAVLLADEGRPVEEVAGQLVWLPELPEAWMWCALREAAAAAVRRGDLDTAERYLTRVLEQVPDHAAAVVELADVLVLMGADVAVPRLAEVVDQLSDIGEKVRILCRVGLLAVAGTWCENAFERLALIMDQGEAAGVDDELLPQVHAVLLTVGLGERDSTARVLERYRLSSRRVADTASGRLVAGVAAQAEMLAGESVAETVALARLGLLPGPMAHAGPAVTAAAVLGVCGASAEGLAALDRVIGTAGSLDAVALATKAGLLERIGDIAQAHAVARSAFEVAEPAEVSLLCAAMASVLLKRGELAEAEVYLDRAGEPRFGWTYGPVMIHKATARRARGDLHGAVDLLLECGRQLMDAGVHNPVWAPWWLDAACLLVRLELREEAADLAAYGVRCAQRWDTPEATGLSLMASGVAAGGEAAVALLESAITELAETSARPLHARAVRLLGESLLADGDAKGAREHLRAAVNLSLRLGDRAAAQEARDLLVLAGGRMPKLGARPADALSGQERRVAELAAAGATNREIAGELFVTLRTVESHLSNVYRKLGVELRADLETSLRTTA